MLTRARKQLHFFCSIKANDFKISENESVDLIRKWITFSEEYHKNNQIVFPHNLHPEINGNKLTFRQINQKYQNANELVNLHRVLTERNWKCKYHY